MKISGTRRHARTRVSSPFGVNYNNLGDVISYARSLGKGMTVYKHPDRLNYNITHTARTDLYKPEWVRYQT